MKSLLACAVVVGVLFVALPRLSGPVLDKRAPGDPGEKTFQIQVKYELPVHPEEEWVTVSERAWDSCNIGESYPGCG